MAARVQKVQRVAGRQEAVDESAWSYGRISTNRALPHLSEIRKLSYTGANEDV